ncbi:MAG: gbd [Caulobacteraceae bacterium]|nr:gbd [Caulobacteraceae bacterium]
MKIVITGGAGFLGEKLVSRLLARGEFGMGEDRAPSPIDRLVLIDQIAAPALGDDRVSALAADIADPAALDEAVGADTDLVFHLAAVVSGQAEADFELGMRVNLDASRQLLDHCRRAGNKPRVVFTSSVAVYGGAVGDVDDQTALRPRSSYGAQKAIGELLLGDYSRRGFVDGRVLRLPTISVRPGAPNRAASSFASGLIREPLNGVETVCPVPLDLRLWLLSPRRAIEAIIAGAELPTEALGDNIALNLPGLSVTVGQMIAALEAVGGREAVDLIRRQPDPMVQAIVGSWPAAWDTSRAEALGLRGDSDFESVIRAYIEDDKPYRSG